MIDVLVVDDDFMVARIHRGFVERIDGFRVVGTASTGEQAVAAVDQLRPDLVLLDLYLPDMFGLDVVTRIRAARHDCDVLVISAAREAEAVRRAVRYGAVNYLLKPFGFDELRTRLEQYAARRAALRAAVVADQADVDRVLSRSGSVITAPALPRGLSPETAELVERALRKHDGTLSASECADRVGISRVSARRYLEHYAGSGRAEVTLKYGAAGRPERRYAWVV
ncbi:MULTISPECIES: response regulator [Micromonospora]|uniref:Transcriptional regulatory protein n=1 Tax=Micromonospora solifontis TaxID=2487138 RepID=A0ABX9WMJ3_9ACTN|nr:MULTISPECIES: response regulator [Micromonospora]NES17204.1 response regulator [Micromonospora sp. PPF5-17B]NES36101.1 response regulator [Micromonospora solifontis]NES54661.1 response regulator [Micromonospora sp. PPF5-6]RNM00016.1 response regulator [Micromonospora solifontis]